ncbi:hypothetical protein D3C73_1671710 [compost metagenome]
MLPEFTQVVTSQGTLQIIYQVSIGDLLVSGLLVLVLVFLLLKAVLTAVWR